MILPGLVVRAQSFRHVSIVTVRVSVRAHVCPVGFASDLSLAVLPVYCSELACVCVIVPEALASEEASEEILRHLRGILTSGEACATCSVVAVRAH